MASLRQHPRTQQLVSSGGTSTRPIGAASTSSSALCRLGDELIESRLIGGEGKTALRRKGQRFDRDWIR